MLGRRERGGDGGGDLRYTTQNRTEIFSRMAVQGEAARPFVRKAQPMQAKLKSNRMRINSVLLCSVISVLAYHVDAIKAQEATNSSDAPSDPSYLDLPPADRKKIEEASRSFVRTKDGKLWDGQVAKQRDAIAERMRKKPSGQRATDDERAHAIRLNGNQRPSETLRAIADAGHAVTQEGLARALAGDSSNPPLWFSLSQGLVSTDAAFKDITYVSAERVEFESITIIRTLEDKSVLANVRSLPGKKSWTGSPTIRLCGVSGTDGSSISSLLTAESLPDFEYRDEKNVARTVDAYRVLPDDLAAKLPVQPVSPQELFIALRAGEAELSRFVYTKRVTRKATKDEPECAEFEWKRTKVQVGLVPRAPKPKNQP